MTFARLLLTVIALLAQVIPGALLARNPVVTSDAECSMSCCAGLAQTTAADVCHCAPAPSAPAHPAPATPPPASGRDLLPQIVWAEAQAFTLPAVMADDLARRGFFAAREARANVVPHVRLAVLFCSFLT